MSNARRQRVRQRARARCEYCQLPDRAAPLARFHVEHIRARQHGGSDTPSNWAWSCHRCNLCKGPNLSGVDPLTGAIVPLFDPRRQRWARHFRWQGPVLVGLTKTGRATVVVLDMNDPHRVELRHQLMEAGEWDG